MIEIPINILLAEGHVTLGQAPGSPVAELDAVQLAAPAGVSERLTAAVEQLAWLGVRGVLVAANPAARRLFGGCDRCGEYALLRETDHAQVGLCELCVDHLLRRVAEVLGAIAGAGARPQTRAGGEQPPGEVVAIRRPRRAPPACR
jgi:hypothetical protein